MVRGRFWASKTVSAFFRGGRGDAEGFGDGPGIVGVRCVRHEGRVTDGAVSVTLQWQGKLED